MGASILPSGAAALTDVVGVLLHDVSLQQVVGQHEGALLHRVQQGGGRPQLLGRAQLLPRCLRLRLQQVVDRRHHGLRSGQQRVRGGRLTPRLDTVFCHPGAGAWGATRGFRADDMEMEMKQQIVFFQVIS